MGVQNDRIKIQLQVHENDGQPKLEGFWEEATGVPKNHFNKTIVRPLGNKLGKSKGTCKVRIHSKQLFLDMANRLDKLRGVVHR